MTFSFPWIHDFQNVVGNTVNEFRRAADDMAESFRPPGQEPLPPAPNPPQQPPPGFPFFFPGAGAAGHPPPPPFGPPFGGPFDGNARRIPPASARAIRQLPTILVTPEDLVDENNRECCICLEPNQLGTKVTRLPCAHIYHSECIVDWLQNHHCTCPVCRYELPTDDPMYEAGRATRMQARKPRFARYELERMSIKELIDLNRGRAVGIREKKDLIQYLIDHERIDLIPAPAPVEFKMEDLKAMRVSELKRAMADAGVFFHAKDVIEKSDMISIFVNSGRLNVIPADDEASKDDNDFTADDIEEGRPCNAALPSKRHLVETVDETSDDEKERHYKSEEPGPAQVEMFPAVSSSPESRADLTTATTNDDQFHLNQTMPVSGVATRLNAVEPTSTEESVSEELERHAACVQPRPDTEPDLVPMIHDFVPVPSVPPSSSSEMSIDTGKKSPVVSPVNPATTSTPDGEMTSHTIDNPTSHSTSRLSSFGVNDGSASKASARSQDDSCEAQLSNESSHVAVEDGNVSTEEAPASSSFAEYSIAQLLTLGREARVNLSSCYDRSEMINLLVSAGVTPRNRIDIDPSSFAHWNIAQLRFLGAEMNIDLSGCNHESEIIPCILHAANAGTRPHLRPCLAVLAPLANLNSSQLRDVARKWELYLPDNLDGDETFQFIIAKANHFGIC